MRSQGIDLRDDDARPMRCRTRRAAVDAGAPCTGLSSGNSAGRHAADPTTLARAAGRHAANPTTLARAE
jgi:hypothetical protein